jgi:hypothetical protein
MYSKQMSELQELPTSTTPPHMHAKGLTAQQATAKWSKQQEQVKPMGAIIASTA